MSWDIFQEVGDILVEMAKGRGRGHWGHKGRKGKRGGSLPSKGVGKFVSSKNAARSFVNEFNSKPRAIGGKVSAARQDPKVKSTMSTYLRSTADRSYWGKQLDNIQESLEAVGFKKFTDPSQKKTTRSFKTGDIVARARKVKEHGRHYVRTDFVDTKVGE